MQGQSHVNAVKCKYSQVQVHCSEVQVQSNQAHVLCCAVLCCAVLVAQVQATDWEDSGYTQKYNLLPTVVKARYSLIH